MKRTLYEKTYVYAIFSNQGKTYVQPCFIVKKEKNYFIVNCHNGGKSGHENGYEFYTYDQIGKEVFFSKDSAEKVRIREENCKKKVDKN